MIALHLMAQLSLPHFLSPIEAWGQVAIERALNRLPQGLLIPLFAWALLRVLPKQNSRTRFAVWFVALLAVVGIACFGGLMLSGVNARIFGLSSVAPARAYSINLPAHWARYLFLAWLVAACFATARLTLGILHLRRLRQSCTPVNAADLDPSLREILDELNAARVFASRPVTLATSESVSVPAALGLWKPMIVLPWWALEELPPGELSIIIRHEFAHLRRWDDWTNLLQKMVRALFFFHPAVWWIESRLSVEREMACDDVVVAQTDNPMGYASCLVSLLERSLAQRGWTMAQAIVYRAREASERLTQILDKNRPATTGISKPALGLVGIFAVLCLLMLPQTPQFVAFDRRPMPAPADHEYSAALRRPAMLHTGDTQPSFRPAVVVPATFKSVGMNAAKWKSAPLKMNEPSSQKASDSVSAHAVAAHHVVERESAVESKYAPTPESLIEVSAFAGQNFHPMIETLIFVETTQFVLAENESSDLMLTSAISNRAAANRTSATTMWRVQVWRVTFVPAVWQHPVHVPVANKT
jgi:beta-lactamase regulating signal transducer with metallopeptidase domain